MSEPSTEMSGVPRTLGPVFVVLRSLVPTTIAALLCAACTVPMKRVQVDYGAPERTTRDERRAAGPQAVDVNTDGTSVTVGLERAIECRTLVQETQAYKEVTVPEKRGTVGLLWLGTGAAIGATALAFAYGPDDAIEFSENGTKVGEACMIS